MSELKNILLEGEEILWSGAPDKAARNGPILQRIRWKTLAWLVVVLLAAAAVAYFGSEIPRDVFWRPMLQALGIILLIAAFFIFFVLVNPLPAPSDFDQVYAITNQRLIVVWRRSVDHVSVMPGAVDSVALMKRGGAHDLYLYFPDRDGDPMTLYGIRDGAAVERLLLERIVRKKAES